LALEDIISSHVVRSDIECSMKCLEEQSCVGYNYRTTPQKINCQISRNTTIERDAENLVNGEWIFYQDMDTLPVSSFRAPIPLGQQSSGGSIPH
jgi:hypothetical protein